MTVLVLEGDARQRWAAAELQTLGYSVRFVTKEEYADGKLPCGADLALFPIPATRDGVHLACSLEKPPPLLTLASGGPARLFGGGFSSDFISRMRHSGREVTDLLSIPSFTEENAALTAEAALGVGMTAAGQSMRGLSVGIVGYGRIASRLCRHLLLLGARVRVFARSEEARLAAMLDGADAYDTALLRRHAPALRLLFNTAPAPLLTLRVTEKLSDCAIVELASGRENITLPEGRGDLSLHFAHSLPGKVFPVSAGRIIARTLDQTMQIEGLRKT
ncbi:MAG: hypothetical protein IJC29_02485 [Clostridia bacterium]|nr:hypothetical protein [Clostridia bacterium]